MPPEIKKNHPLRDLNTFKVGGAARYYLEARDKESLRAALTWATEKGVKCHILGGGSNILIPDKGIDGLVIRLANDEKEIKGERLFCGAGTPLMQAANLCLSHGLSGLEWSYGIPRATIGGAIRGNAGAFGQGIDMVVENVEVFDRKRGEFENLSRRMCRFGYRMSLFKESDRYIIWQACLKMTPKNEEEIRQKMDASQDFRLQKYPRLPSAGSVFENLVPEKAREMNPEFFDKELKDKVGREGFLAAGLLIDMAGLKGKSIGGIKISLEHANHIVNTGNGTSEEVIMMISYIKQQVRDRFGIQLHEEIVYFGFD